MLPHHKTYTHEGLQYDNSSKRLPYVHAQSNIRYLARLTIMGGIVVSCDSGVIKFQKEVGREKREG